MLGCRVETFTISSFKSIKTKVVCWLCDQLFFIDITLSIIFIRKIHIELL